MGFLSDMRALKKLGDEIQRTQPPVAQRNAAAIAGMQQATAMLAQLTTTAHDESELRASGLPAPAIVSSVRSGAATVNVMPVLEVDLVVQAPGRPPLPVTVTVTAPPHLVHRVAVGAQLPVFVDHARGRAAIDWVRLEQG